MKTKKYPKNKRAYTIPSAKEDIFRKRVLFITGVGRSGTTILGKLIGSLQPTCYLFEPALMKLAPFLILNASNSEDKRIYSLLIRSLLFEDYFLQLIHGRNLNFNVRDDSYVGNYMCKSAVERRWNELSRRQDVVEHLKKERPLLVMKIPEFQPFFALSKQIFSQPKFIHIIRNGNEVVLSALKRGWYTNVFMNRAIVEWAKKRKGRENCNIPWYLDKESKKYFPRWNVITRAATVWRNLTEQGMSFYAKEPESCLQFKYEDFIRSPDTFLKQFERTFGLKPTKITQQHIASIRTHKPSHYPSVYKDVAEPEYSKFMSLMEKLGYI
jgi:hypothetical protein